MAPARRFIRVSSDISVEFAATLCVNPPTAYRMLKDFVSLQPGKKTNVHVGAFYANNIHVAVIDPISSQKYISPE